MRRGTENPRWGWSRIRGELRTLGIRVLATTIRTLLRADGLGPAARRGGPAWAELLRSQAEVILAVDVFPVDTLLLPTVDVLVAIEPGSRRVHLLGVTANPDSAWVTPRPLQRPEASPRS